MVGTNVEFLGTYGDNGVRTYTIDYGQITNSFYTYYGPGGVVWNSNMLNTNIVTHVSDSGCPLIINLYIGEGYYENNVIGILSLGNSYSSLFCKTGDILSALNLTGY